MNDNQEIPQEARECADEVRLAVLNHQFATDSIEIITRHMQAFAKRQNEPKAHAGDCTIYAAMVNGMPTDGICTCGLGLALQRKCDDSETLSADKVKAIVAKREELATLRQRAEAAEAKLKEVTKAYGEVKDWAHRLEAKQTRFLEECDHHADGAPDATPLGKFCNEMIGLSNDLTIAAHEQPTIENAALKKG